MKNKNIISKTCIFLLVAVLGLATVLSACAEPEETTTTPATSEPATQEPATSEPATSEPATSEPATQEPAATELEWYEEMWGQPEYGGTMTIAKAKLGDAWDPYFPFNANFYTLEQMFMSDMTTDRDVWSYKVTGASPDYVGMLAESWEWEDPQTLVINLRQNVKWQDKQPTYGREFTADDVVYHYDRLLGTGEFAEPNPFTRTFVEPIIAVSARDTYTVVMEFKDPTPMANWWAATDPGAPSMIEAREFVESDVMDWQNVTGTGPYMVTDYIAGNSVTMSKNPDYYRYDDRYPENKLPYLDTLKIIGILDSSTMVAAIRSGQVDMVYNLDWQTAQNLQKTNPEVSITSRPYQGITLDTRCDNEFFSDIRVRKALQLAIDTQTIAAAHYGGTVSGYPPSLVSLEYGDWAYPYEDWPEDLQQEYTYDPEQAKALMAEAGYPDGFETDCYVPNEQDIDLMQIVKAYLAEIGVEMNIEVVDQNQLSAISPTIETVTYGEYSNQPYGVNMCLFNRTSMQAQNQVHAAEEEVGPYNELYAQFMAATDEATAKELSHQAQEYYLRQHWAVHTTARVYYDAIGPRVRGFAGEDAQGWSCMWFWDGFWVVDSE